MKDALMIIIGFCRKNLKLLSFLLLIASFLYTRLPFYFFYGIPGFSTDSNSYYYMALLIRNWDINQLRQLPVDYPLGYPFFLAAFYNISNIYIVLIQSIIFFLSSWFLFSTLYKFLKEKSLIFLPVICLYFFDSSLQHYETTILIESLFTSGIFFAIGLFVRVIFSERKENIYLLFLPIIFLMLLRPNGVVFFAAPILLLFLKKFRHQAFIKQIAIGYFGAFLLLSTINFVFKGYFFPVEFNRYIEVLKKDKVTHEIEGDIYRIPYIFEGDTSYFYYQPKPEIFENLIQAYPLEYASFYYTGIPGRIENIEKTKKLPVFFGHIEIESETRNRFLKELESLSLESYKKPDLSKKNYLYVVHVLSRTNAIFLRNYFVYGLFIISTLIVIARWILFRKSLSNNEVILIASFLLYYLNVLFSTIGHFRAVNRYVVVFDILVLIGAVLGLLGVFEKFKDFQKVKR